MTELELSIHHYDASTEAISFVNTESGFIICSQATEWGAVYSCVFTAAKSQPGLFRAQQTVINKNKSY